MGTTISVAYNSEWGCVVNTITGPIAQEDAERSIQQVSALCTEHGCKRILNDIRLAQNKLSVAELYHLPKKAVGPGLDRTCKRAILVQEMFADARFYEDAASNAGIRVKVFDSLDNALQWLHAK